jgi:hypothetical protein
VSERELRQLFAQGSRDIDARQRQRIRDLKGLERELFEALVKKLVDVLDQGDGVIKTRRGSASINELVDQVFRALERSTLKEFYRSSVVDMFAILGNNDAYNEQVYKAGPRASDKRYKAIRSEVDTVMRKKLGIDDKGRVIPNGTIGKFFRTDAMRTALKDALNAGLVSGKPVGKLVRELEVATKGTRLSPGVLQKALTPLVFDTYQQFDRASNDAYATKIGLDTFIYVGGLIETSRRFCEKHHGKVFTKEEAEKQWPKDPDLPKTKVERESGSLVGYNPTVDLGRWNCRHRTRYIPRGLAEELRPDLKR